MKINKIYLDMDGVIADFDKWVKDNIGILTTQKDTWDGINKYYEKYPTKLIFQNFELMPNAMDLFNYVNKYNPTFLTSTGKNFKDIDKITIEKINWANIHFPNTEIIVVNSSKQKSKYADENSILIDDREKCIIPWVDAGGIGILHKNVFTTIENLKIYGL